MKPQRVLALVHKGLEPPDEKVDKTTALQAEWRMEYDVVRTLKVLGHDHPPRVIRCGPTGCTYRSAARGG